MGVHRFAVATALATFCLLVAGGLVSTTESGLACPDWPLCEGKYIPPMIDGKQFEHTHRLVASFVAVMTFGLCALLFKHRRHDRPLTRLGVAAALLVVAQALLGALTVKLSLPAWVSSTHLAVAMLFFVTAVSLAFLTRQRLPAAAGGRTPLRNLERSRRLGRRVLAVGLLTYAQIAIGAVMRHTRGGLACGYDFPLCLGQVWPLHGHLGVQAHMLHRLGGTLVGIAGVWLAVRLWRGAESTAALRWLALGLGAGVLAQGALGIATILSSRDMVVMTAHSTLGAALLSGLTAAYWLVRPSRPPEPASRTEDSPATSLELA